MAEAGRIRQLLEQGIALQRRGALTDAESRYRAALDEQPDCGDAVHLLGLLRLQQGDTAQARELLGRAATLQPDNVVFLLDYANLLAGLDEFAAALAQYRHILALRPDHAVACARLADLLRRIGEYEPAERAYRLALRLDPGLTDAAVNLGLVLYVTGRLSEALEWMEQALRRGGPSAAVLGNMALCLNEMGRISQAVEHATAALQLQPDFAACHSNLLLSRLYDEKLDIAQLSAAHGQWAQRHGAPPTRRCQSFPVTADPDRPLRIGYVSPDLRVHSVAYFLEAILANHDRGRFAPYCYSQGLQEDQLTQRLKGYASGWCNTTRLDDPRLVERVRDDRIDILIDCAGHMANSRLRLFSFKPAPVQVTYLGYPFTTGLETIDYRLTDGRADPAGEDRWYREKLWRLDGCFLCYTPWRGAPGVGPAPCTAADTITLGCCNSMPKLNASVIALWARILAALPRARLLLKNKALTDEKVRGDLAAAFAGHGIAAERLALVGHAPSITDHLAIYHEIDIALDPFPYNGTTTTCEALWMGVPVVVLAGGHHGGRVGVSLLSTIGQPELIAQSQDEYVGLVCRLASDKQRLSSLRQSLRPAMAASPLCDGPAFTRGIEAAYRQMWQRWCREDRT